MELDRYSGSVKVCLTIEKNSTSFSTSRRYGAQREHTRIRRNETTSFISRIRTRDRKENFRSFRARSVNIATLFMGKPPRQFTSA